MEEIFKSSPSLANYELRNANGKFGRGKIKTSLKLAQEFAKIPEVYKDEYEILISYKDLIDKKDEKNKGQKETVVIHHILAKETIDEDVMKALENKNKTQAALIDAVKANLK